MKNALVLCFALLTTCLLLTSCGEKEKTLASDDPATNAVGDLNLESLSTVASDVAKKLMDIKDLPSAAEVRDKVAPMLDQLAEAKGKINMDSLAASAKALKLRFATKQDVLEALKPILERISSLGE